MPKQSLVLCALSAVIALTAGVAAAVRTPERPASASIRAVASAAPSAAPVAANPEVAVAPLATRAPSAVAAAPVAAACPSWTKVPSPGRYVYSVVTKATGEPDENDEETRRIFDNGGTACARRQVIDDADVTWTQEGLVLVRSEECDWQPDILDLKAPLAAGATWSADSTCSHTEEGETLSIRHAEQVKVLEFRPKAVVRAGTTAAWVLQRTITVTFSGFGESHSTTSVDTELFSPEHGLVIAYDSTTKGTDPEDGDYVISMHRELTSFSPEP